jgi:glycosyltransferase involved in cell wall biosynthesis
MENPMEKRPAVVHVITQLELGGAQRNTLHTLASLDRKRFMPSLVCGPGGALDQEARALGIPVTFVPQLQRSISPLRDWEALGALKTAISLQRKKTHGPLLVHTHSSKAGFLGRLAGRQLSAQAVVHTVHGFPFHPGQPLATRLAYQAMEKLVAPMTDAMLFVSRADMRTAERLGLVATDGGHLVRSGIALDAFVPDTEARRRTRAELQIPDDARVVVTTANFKAQKNPLMGLAAFARVASAVPNAVWLFLGDGELRPAFEAQAAQLGLTQRIRLLGWRSDVAACLNAGDVYMLPSDHEGLPRSVLEALAVGLPVAATDTGGTLDVVTPSVGRLVKVGDAVGMADAVVDLLRSPPAGVRELAAASLKEFDIHQMVRAQEHIYQWLVSTPLR